MFPPLPEEKAAFILEKVILALRRGLVSLEQAARPSQERKNQPVMTGVLVCKNKNGGEVALVTNSGNAKRMHNVQCAMQNYELIYVDSIVSAEQIEKALSENDKRIHKITEKIQEIKSNITNADSHADSEAKQLREERGKLCAESLEKVHALYNFHCIDGKIRSLKEICARYNQGKLPPTGTGDCCAPKLFDYAFSHEFFPISLAETAYTETSGNDCSTAEGVPLAVWSNSGSAESVTAKPDRPTPTPSLQTPTCSLLTPHSSLLTPPCDERCGILLPAMLGLRILWRDSSICVVNKESGILSVPGRGEDKKDCVESRFRRLFGDSVEIAQPAVHRLDMETSGIMILAFTKAAHRELNRQFEAKEIQKEYVALLDGVLARKGIGHEGQMELFFRLDPENRPHQIWDAENGKSAVTQWQVLDVERYHAPDGSTRNATRVLFKPHTGRTHQLRLASADCHGFGTAIIGDSLYGHCDEGERLMLHAQKITFTHPVTGERMTIDCPAEF